MPNTLFVTAFTLALSVTVPPHLDPSPPRAPACAAFVEAIALPLAAGNERLVVPPGGLDAAARQRLHGLLATYPGAEHPEDCAPLHYLRLAELLAADAAAHGDAAAPAAVAAAAWDRAVAAAQAPSCPTVVLAVHATVLQRLAERGLLALPPARLAALAQLLTEDIPALRAQVAAGWDDGRIGPAEERALANVLRARFVAEVLAGPEGGAAGGP